MLSHTLKLSGAMAQFSRMEMKTYLVHPLAMFWTFAYPVILFLLMNTIFGGQYRAGSIRYADYLITGLPVLTIFTSALFSFVLPLIELRASNKLRMLGLFPVPGGVFFAGFALSRTLILAVFTLLFVMLMSHLAPGATPVRPRTLAWLMMLAVSGSLAMIGVGIILASIVKRTATATALANILNVPVIFLSDLFLPVAIFPGWLQAVAHRSPLYQFVTLLRAVYADNFDPAVAVAWSAGMIVCGIVMIGFGARRFNWVTSDGR
ncbi:MULTISPECIES: ABC transporter permease [unclassified Paraburkholderia]|uniref:ABC transporter permease n=1 Tax=unclassified Paraburkholderia TaxID=2615204 RepID=UPI002AB0E72E|nr:MULTISPECIES: ABC transporter permease [unclassified Paraburkholderia]